MVVITEVLLLDTLALLASFPAAMVVEHGKLVIILEDISLNESFKGVYVYTKEQDASVTSSQLNWYLEC